MPSVRNGGRGGAWVVSFDVENLAAGSKRMGMGIETMSTVRRIRRLPFVTGWTLTDYVGSDRISRCDQHEVVDLIESTREGNSPMPPSTRTSMEPDAFLMIVPHVAPKLVVTTTFSPGRMEGRSKFRCGHHMPNAESPVQATAMKVSAMPHCSRRAVAAGSTDANARGKATLPTTATPITASLDVS